jgi:hypothetical protein
VTDDPSSMEKGDPEAREPMIPDSEQRERGEDSTDRPGKKSETDEPMKQNW